MRKFEALTTGQAREFCISWIRFTGIWEYLRLTVEWIAVIEFGVNNWAGDGTSCSSWG